MRAGLERAFNIVNKAAQGGDYAIATFNGKSSNIVEADIEATGSGLQYVALILGYRDLNNNYFIKAQDNNGGTPEFNRLYCYYGNNLGYHNWANDPISLNPSFELYEYLTPLPPFPTLPIIKASYPDILSNEIASPDRLLDTTIT